jgi:hypothetical protein
MLFSQRRRRPIDRSGRHTGLPAAAALPATAAVVPTATAFPSPAAVTRALAPPAPASARVRAHCAEHAFQDPARSSRVNPTAGALTAETIVTVGG